MASWDQRVPFRSWIERTEDDEEHDSTDRTRVHWTVRNLTKLWDLASFWPKDCPTGSRSGASYWYNGSCSHGPANRGPGGQEDYLTEAARFLCGGRAGDRCSQNRARSL